MGEAKPVDDASMFDVDDDIAVDDPAFDPTSLGFATRAAFDSFVQEGIDSFERDGGIPHHVVMAELDQLLADLAARRAAAK